MQLQVVVNTSDDTSYDSKEGKWQITPEHIWIGTSVEDQTFADNRIPALLEIPSQVRWLSCEPLLGPLDLTPYLNDGGIGWVIDGGESGRGRRPAEYGWFQTIRDDCLKAGVPYLHKQGTHRYPGHDRELDGRTWDQYPAVTRNPFIPRRWSIRLDR